MSNSTKEAGNLKREKGCRTGKMYALVKEQLLLSFSQLTSCGNEGPVLPDLPFVKKNLGK